MAAHGGRNVLVIAGFDSVADDVRGFVKTLDPDADVVLVGDEPTPGNAAALVQCRCSSIVAVQYRQAGNGRKALEMRERRDRIMLADADVVVVFGTLAPDRDATLEARREAGLPVERR